MQCRIFRSWLVFLACLWVTLSVAQVDDVDNPTLDLPEVDTSYVPPSVDTTQKRKQGLLSIFYGAPGRAALYGLVIPGGGQWYNRRYWKVPLAIALDGFAAYNLIESSRQYRRWNQALIDFNDDKISMFEDQTSARGIKLVRDAYRRQREYGILIMTGAHIFTFMEAFIDRHLIDFDVSDDLTLGWEYGQSSNTLAFGVFYTL